jgi:tRNA threonylcarbamoyladenosine biosynthesis protein TsaB
MSSSGMKILALETSGAACSVAVLAAGALAAHRREPMLRGQSEALLPMVRDAMLAAGLGFPDLDLVAATVGPGAFTGIRIGLAAARGIGLAAGKPVLGVTTFEAIGEAALWPPALLAAVDSRREDVLFLQCLPGGAPAAVAPADVARFAPPGRVLVAGDAAARAAALVGPRAEVLEALPDAAAVARLAATRWRPGATPAPPRPLYLRAADTTAPKR